MDKKIEKEKDENFSPFSHPFLKKYSLDKYLLPWTEKELAVFDRELLLYEKSLIGVDVEKGLIDRNELLISYAISKAENSSLTLVEAKDLRRRLIDAPDYNFLNEKLKTGKKLTRKDYEALEFFNIIKVFRKYSGRNLSLNNLTPKFILNIHAELTAGLDLFAGYLPGFDAYKSGQWRDNDLIRIARFVPAPHEQIIPGVKELMKFIQANPGAVNIALFHGALYALHPFCNGNKRVCRILEYLLLRASGYNNKALYNASFYYHKHKERYYKKLLDTLLQQNFNHFVSFLSEALFYSITGVIKTSLNIKKKEFLKQFELDAGVESILRPLIKNSEVQFNRLWALNKRRPSKQTFSNYLRAAASQGALRKREEGRNVYYSLAGEWPESRILRDCILSAAGKISYIPEEFRSI
jgi:Fic family protein